MNIIKKIRKENNLSQSELANILNVHQTAVSQWENERTKPDIAVAKLISQKFNISLDIILENEPATSDLDYEKYNLKPIKFKKFRMLGEIACGKPLFCNEDYETFVEASSEIEADFCLIAKGDSMINARIYDGDVVFIKFTSEVINGEIAAVIINDEATLKRVYYYKDENKLVLAAENPKYAPLVYLNEELDSINILGRAVTFMSYIK